ncbi:MAG: hypothetical protein ACU85E_09940 [Gammaproteobacteria bacterium]
MFKITKQVHLRKLQSLYYETVLKALNKFDPWFFHGMPKPHFSYDVTSLKMTVHEAVN